MKGFDQKFKDFPDYILGIQKKFGKTDAFQHYIITMEKTCTFVCRLVLRVETLE